MFIQISAGSPNLDFSDGIDAYYVNHDGNADNKYVIGRNSYGSNSPDYGNDYVSYYIEDTGYTYTDVWVYTHSYGQFKLSVLHQPRLQGVLCVR